MQFKVLLIVFDGIPNVYTPDIYFLEYILRISAMILTQYYMYLARYFGIHSTVYLAALSYKCSLDPPFKICVSFIIQSRIS